MLELDPKIMIRNRQHRQSLITYRPCPLRLSAQHLRQTHLQELVLEQYNGEHDMLERVLVAVQLAQHCAQVQMGVGEGFRLLDAQLQLQGLD